LGKTHLLHAIGHRLTSAGQSLIYSTTEEFTNEYISAIRESRTEEFRNRYRGADVLLLDDLQFLIGKEQTQEGFFHTFNALHMTNRQIVITIDRPVSSLNLLEDRVRSRLGGGLVVDIQAPDLETRLAILRTKSEAMGQQVPSDVLQFLAERVRNNIRELEGTLNRLIAYARFTRTPITLDAAKRALNGASAQDGTRQLSPQEIVDTVSSYYRVGAETLPGPRGRKQVALARQVAMYLMRERAGLGPTGIGRVLGGRHHATVIKNCTKIARLLDTDPDLRRDVDSIRDSLTAA
jgi:chromosomal replication initiator protein